ncbi:hypothetical protein GOP47_0020361 [Adiantum capillus-veneris]|uniref:Phospholipase A2 family protein n=1 Tax=Adiantum capillus-veneris TaxID=13818 RepID=A0A9D4ZAJ4_ADICA|nr:hypothetical protein GOP47_0019888 [Adiantum capillus-veneris]KAI5065666.1 hypothetical protein GOP47_0020361 [Adiantum capillus-veneris]
MDVKLLRTVLASGKAPSSTPAPLQSMSSRPSAFPPPLSSPEDDLIAPSSSAVRSQAKASEALEEAAHNLPPFTPYSAQVPWHTGMRAFFSQVFPKYGHYCGPNWSSGRNGGSLLWDKPPIDWVDHCCFCHDVGYDSHDQAQLYKADLELLECLQKMPPPKQSQRQGKGLSLHSREDSNGAIAWLYRNLYITGLQSFLLPYRRMLLRDMRRLPRKE